MSAVIPARGTWRWRGSLTGAQRLIAFATALGACGVVLLATAPADQATATWLSVPWWAVLVACYATSVVSVQLRVSGFGTTLSLSDIPLAVGLFTVEPRILAVCYVAGVLAGNWTRRGMQPLLDYSRLMLDVLYVAAAVVVFAAVGPARGDPATLRSVVALVAAMLTAGCVVSPLALSTGSYLYAGRFDGGESVRALALQAAASITSTCIALVGLALAHTRPLLALALLPPAAFVLLGQRAAGETRRRADRMEFLYHTNEVLHSSSRIDERAGEMLRAMAATFGVARAELLLLPEARGAAIRFISQGRDDRAEVSSAELTYAEQETLNLLRDEPVLTASESDAASPVGLLLAERHMRFGTVAALRGHEKLRGMLLLLDPLHGDLAPAGQERNLLLAVSSQISAAFENGQLAGAIRAMSAEKDELTRRAFYDPLTQIPNRALFLDTVSKAFTRMPDTRRALALMFIDLDGFKQINDTHGHAMGDEVLNGIAARLRAQIRKLDMVARLGGDEFGILINGMRNPTDAPFVARRIVAILHSPLQIDGQVVCVGGSVGVTVVDDPLSPLTPDEALRRADMAMYLAKRQGKNRYVIFDNRSRDTVIAAAPEVLANTM